MTRRTNGTVTSGEYISYIFWKYNRNIYNGLEFAATNSTSVQSGVKAMNCQGWRTSVHKLFPGSDSRGGRVPGVPSHPIQPNPSPPYPLRGTP